MRDLLRMQRTSIAAGAIAVAGVLGADLLLPTFWQEGVRDNAFDFVLAADHWLRPARDPSARDSSAQDSSAQDSTARRVVVVDIDRRSLKAVGSWPWPRATTAALIEAIAAAKPAAAAVDILFAERDFRCPAALGAACESAAPASRSNGGDELLARAASQAPLVIGFVLDPAGQGALPQVPIARLVAVMAPNARVGARHNSSRGIFRFNCSRSLVKRSVKPESITTAIAIVVAMVIPTSSH